MWVRHSVEILAEAGLSAMAEHPHVLQVLTYAVMAVSAWTSRRSILLCRSGLQQGVFLRMPLSPSMVLSVLGIAEGLLDWWHSIDLRFVFIVFPAMVG